MALIALSDDALGVIFEGLRNVLEPCVAVALSSACHGLLAPTQALRQQLRADHTAAAALCVKVGLRSCKELHEARQLTAASRVTWATRSITAADPQLGITVADIQQHNKASMEEMFLFFTAADLATLGSLGSVLPALEELHLGGATCAAGALRLAAGLGAGSLPAVVLLDHSCVGIFDDADALAFASAFGAALGRGALPRLKFLDLSNTMMGDAALLSLAPALRRMPALETLGLAGNPLGDEGLAALVAPPPPPPGGVLTKLKKLDLFCTEVTDAGCKALVAAIRSGALPALNGLELEW